MPKKEDEPKPAVETDYPNVSEWVSGCGWIEIGDQDWRGFAARALDEGGIIYEKERCRNLGEAMAALEAGLGEWFKENG